MSRLGLGDGVEERDDASECNVIWRVEPRPEKASEVSLDCYRLVTGTEQMSRVCMVSRCTTCRSLL